MQNISTENLCFLYNSQKSFQKYILPYFYIHSASDVTSSGFLLPIHNKNIIIRAV